MPLVPTSRTGRPSSSSTSSSAGKQLVDLHPRPPPLASPPLPSLETRQLALTSRRSMPRLTPLQPPAVRAPIPGPPRSMYGQQPSLSPPPPPPLLPFSSRRPSDDYPPRAAAPPRSSLAPRSRSSGATARSSRRRRPAASSALGLGAGALALEIRSGSFRFRTDAALGQGAFGTVLAGVDERTGREVAVKLEPILDVPGRSQLANEVGVINKLAGGAGMPRFRGWSVVSLPLNAPVTASAPVSPSHSRAPSPAPPHAASAQWTDCALLVTDRLGPSVATAVRTRRGRPVELETVLRVGAQLVDRLAFVHSRGFLHRDVKPDNVLLGLKPHDRGLLTLIDYGLAEPFRTAFDGTHVEPSHSGRVVGTHMFMSRDASRGLQSSRRDDLESVGYILLWLLGPLPWASLTHRLDLDHDPALGPAARLSSGALETVRLVEQAKERTVRRLVESRGRTSVEGALGEFFSRLGALKFKERPDYQALRDIFVRCGLEHGFVRSGPAVF